jgi:hypothetical protein
VMVRQRNCISTCSLLSVSLFVTTSIRLAQGKVLY